MADPESSFAPGQRLGPYSLVSRLGAGGMGEIYLAQDTRLGRQVALKFLPPSFRDDSERLRRFQNEARAASALNHPNVATIYEIGEAENIAFIAMDNEMAFSRLSTLTPSLRTSDPIVDTPRS